jgi:hypothetical protein
VKQNPRARSARVARAYVEPLESRRLLSTSVSMFHNDIASDGVNSTETQLTPVNVKVGSFGELYTTPLDGAVYAEPLIEPQQTITAGPNTTTGATGVSDVAIVATENDSLYAINVGNTAAAGTVLWQRSFTNLTAGQAGSTPGSDINDVLGASSITTVADAAVDAADISPVMGITGTPVVDSSTGIIYLVTFTTEIIGGATHYVQMLHGINISNGTDAVAPYLLGDTTNGNINNTPIWVYGTGDGNVPNPYNSNGGTVVQFNALRENQRCALSLVNGTLYVEWASHADNGPYHGWVVTWNVSNILTTGLAASGVLCSSPNGGESGIWMGGGAMTFEPNGSAFYFETGNGPADGGGTQLNAAGFPVTGDYPDALVKAELDPTTSVNNQGVNGWGIKIVDYFIPYNQAQLDDADEDFGSGQPLLLPASAGIPGYPDLIIAAGKAGTIYLLDADDLGHYNGNGDAALNSVPNGSGQNTPPVLIDGALSAPAYFDGEIYWNTGYNGPAEQLSISSTGTLSITGETPETNLGYIPGSVIVSSNGASNGILWVTDRNTNELHAYETGNLSDELWNSGQNTSGADATGAITKFAAPTVANGQVYLGSGSSLVVYGLKPPETAAPVAPVLSGMGLSSSSVSLSWTDSSVRPNLASGYLIEELVNGVYKTVTTAAAGTTSINVGGLSPLTSYSFRIQGFNGVGDSPDSNIVTVTTTNTAPTLNLSTGFANSAALLTYNGSAAISGSDAQLINGGGYESGSVFSDTPFNVSEFNTTFEFQTTDATNTGDGFTFTIQGNSLTAVGGYGGALGYGAAGTDAAIGNSIAIKFDLYSNDGEGPDSTGLYENGATPTLPSTDLSQTGINLHDGDVFAVNMSYNGTDLTVTITDTTTNASATQVYAVNIPSIVGPAAYVGFTAGDGGITSTINVLNWSFTPPAALAPAAPTGLGATPASATSVTLTWTNNADNETGFLLDRALDSGFTTDLITQTLPASPDSFTDTYTGLSPGTTYYYRIRAVNSAGTSANSAAASASIPVAPNKPTDAMVDNVTTSEIDLQWMDNAGKTANGYYVLRAVNQGAFTLYASLPALNGADQEGGPQSPIYTWSDTNVQPGTFYEYHIEAYNISGYNDFAGTGTTTITLPPSGLTATAGNDSVSLSWTAPTAAVAYNLYRGTASGGETLLDSDITSTSYVDTTATNGTPYYYYVTALNGNLAPIPEESAASNQVSATPFTTVVPAINFASGFANSTSSLKYNGSATISGSDAQLTNGGAYEAGSVFSSAAVNVAQFNTRFEFQTTAGTNTADGFTFTLQGASPNAVGGYGGALGYGAAGSASAIASSVAIKFDLYSNAGEGPDSTGIYENGATPTTPSTDLTSTGINLHSGDIFAVTMAYNGTNLVVTITDTTTKATATQTYAVNIPSYTGSSAYVGFTAGTGGMTSTMNILNWTFTPGAVAAPTAPSGLAGTAASATSVTLNWTNNATNETGFYLDRATNSTFTTNLVTQTLPATPDSFTDSLAGLAAGGTYYYRIRAYNSGGSSTNSATATITIPSVPAAPVLTATASSSSSIGLTWTDPSTSAQAATGYLIQELENGSYQQIATAAAGATSATVSSLSSGTSYSFRIVGYNISGDSPSSNVATTSTTASAAINFASGFAGSTSSLKYNGSATISGSDAQLTNGGAYEAGSVFSSAAVNVAQFNTRFEFQTTAGTNTADGFTFTLQGASPNAVGGYGGALGYGAAGSASAIASSVAIKFDLYSNAGEGPDSTGIYENGATPTTPSTDLTSTGINLHSGDIFAVTMAYNGTNLVVTITDTTTKATATQTYAVNIPSYTGSSAYVGFTAGTGGMTSTMNILNWTFTPGAVAAPTAPSGLAGTAASATSVTLNWTNNATNETGFYLDRATNSTFTTNLVTQTLPATPDSFTDSLAGLAAGGTYYYRIRAYNSGGSSTNSATATITIPSVPAAPVLTATASSSSSIGLTWTDPSTSAQAATGYLIQELENGSYQQIATAAAGATSATVSSLSSGTSYSFRIVGYNISGDSPSSNVATTSTTASAAINFASGFAGSTSSLKYNGTATVSGNDAQLVNSGAYQAGSVFTSAAVSVAQFSTSFEFQTTAGTNTADGFTFSIQGASPTALGGIGSGMGYGTDGAANSPLIGQSVAIKFGLYSSVGAGPDSTGIYENGAAPALPSTDLTSTGINLHSGDVFAVTMVYNGTNLVVTITDTATNAMATQTYAINIPSYAGSAAYVGFTAGTGALTSTINILNWTFTPGAA